MAGDNEYVIDLRINGSKLPADLKAAISGLDAQLQRIATASDPTQRGAQITKAQEQVAAIQAQTAGRKVPVTVPDSAGRNVTRDANLSAVYPGFDKKLKSVYDRLLKAEELNAASAEKAANTRANETNQARIEASQQRRRELADPLNNAALEEEAKTSLHERIAAEKKRVANAQIALGQEKVDFSNVSGTDAQQERQLRAQRILLEKQVNQQLAQQLKTTVQQAGGGAEGSLFQRLEAGISQRFGQSGKLATDFQSFSQFASSKLLTTAGFAASGGIFYSLFQGAQNVFEETKLLETQFALLGTQLDNLGRGEEFEQIRQGIFDVARETGVTTSQLAELGVQLAGAFSSKGPEFVTEQIRAAAQIERVTGLTTTETVDSLTAINKTFGNTAREVGDTAVGLQQRFGVLSKQIITFSADLAPVAQQAGLSFKQLASLGAAVQQQSGRSGAGLAESLGRVFGSLQENAATILSLYQSNDKLASRSGNIAKLLAGGDTGPVLLDLIKNYKDLNRAQQNLLASALGGSRQAPVLSALFTSDSARAELNNPTKDAGKLEQQFEDLHDVIEQVVERLKVSLTQIGVILAEAGIVPFLKDAAAAADVLVQAMTPIVALITSITGGFKELTGTDLVTKILGIAVAFRAVQSFGAARAAGAGGKEAAVSAATLGLFKPGQEQPIGPIVNPNLGAPAAAAAVTKSIREKVTTAGKEFYGGLKSGFTSLKDNRSLQLGAVGLTAGVIGQEIGSNALTAAGVGLGLGAINPYLGAVAAASTLIGGWLEAGDQADRDGKALQAKYQDLFDQGKTGPGSKFAKALSGQDVDNSFSVGKILKGANTLADTGSPDTAQKAEVPGLAENQAAVAVVNSERLKKLRFILNRILKDASDKALKGVIPKYQASLREVIKNTLTSDDASTYTEVLAQAQFPAHLGGVDFGAIDADYKKLNPKKNTLKQFLKTQDTGGVDQLLQTADSEYQSGVTSRQQLIATYNTVIKADELLVRTGAASQETVAQLIKTQAAKAKLFSDSIKEDVDFQTQLLGFTRQDTPENISALNIAALQNPKLTDRADRASILQNIFSNLDKAFNAYVGGAKDAADKVNRINTGIAIDPTVQLEIIEVQVASALERARAQKGLIKFSAASGEPMQKIYSEIALIAKTYGISIRDATKAWVDARIAELTALITSLIFASIRIDITKKGVKKALDKLLTKLDAATAELSGLQQTSDDLGSVSTEVPTAPDTYTGSAQDFAGAVEDANKEAEDLAKRIAEAQIAILKALAGDDPVKQALADLQAADVEAAYAKDEAEALQAQAAKINAQHAYDKAIQAIAAARIDVLKAFAGNNAAETARLGIVAAYAAIYTAEGEAAQLQAVAQGIQALKQYQQAVFNDTFGAVFTVQSALAAFAGDAVKQAQLQFQNAQDNLAFLRSQGAGTYELAQAQAQAIQAQTQIRDAQLQEKEATIDFNLQTKQISTAQAIAQYEALLNNANVLQLTIQQRRDLVLKIQQLKQGLEQNLQFDLPTDLRLPTLYEARRLNQSGGAYQDNRVVTISLTSTDPQSTAAAVSQIEDALNAPPLFGGGGRIY